MAVIINGDTGIDKITDGSVTTADLASTLDLSGKTMTYGNLPAANLTGSLPAGMGGKILQVVQDTKTDTFSTSSTSFVDVTGLSVSITPSSTSSKILVMVSLSLGTDLSSHVPVKLMRDSTAIAIGDSAGSRNRATFHLSAYNNYTIDSYNMTWLDSPATTSATTYKVQTGVPWSSSYIVYINRSSSDNDAAYQSRVVSTITAIEVGA